MESASDNLDTSDDNLSATVMPQQWKLLEETDDQDLPVGKAAQKEAAADEMRCKRCSEKGIHHVAIRHMTGGFNNYRKEQKFKTTHPKDNE